MRSWKNIGLYETPDDTLPSMAPQKGPKTALPSSPDAPLYRFLGEVKRLASLFGSAGRKRTTGAADDGKSAEPYQGLEELYDLLRAAHAILPALVYAQGVRYVATNIALQMEAARRLAFVEDVAASKELKAYTGLERASTWETAWLSLLEKES